MHEHVLQTILLGFLQESYPSLEASDVTVEISETKGRRLLSGRVIIRITIIKRAGVTFSTQAAADSVVSIFDDGTLHELLPSFPVAHAQRDQIGEWTCWFNWDSPNFVSEHEDKGTGDYEDIDHILLHYSSTGICEGGATPTGIHCRTADHVAWKKAGQILNVPCSVSKGIVCLNKDNPDRGCSDYQVT